MKGFSHELPSLGKIKKAVKKQEDWLASGKAVDTGTPADKFARKRHGEPGNGLRAIDDNGFPPGWYNGQRPTDGFPGNTVP